MDRFAASSCLHQYLCNEKIQTRGAAILPATICNKQMQTLRRYHFAWNISPIDAQKVLYLTYTTDLFVPPSCLQQYATNHKVGTYKEYHSVCPSSELGLPPTPNPQASVPPPPCFWGEGNTRWRERGWESPNSNEGHTLWYSLYVRTLCDKQMQTTWRRQLAFNKM
jgi:hypothetical protein